MSFTNKLKYHLKKNLWVLYLWNLYRIYRHKRWRRIYHDEYKFLANRYKLWEGVEPNLINPKNLTEKYIWLKLFYRNPRMIICADKYRMREILDEYGYKEMQIPLLGVWERVEDIDFSALPDKFILKANNGSGANFFCKDKNHANLRMWKRIMNCWLKQDISTEGLEWPYQQIPPKIVGEKYLETQDNNLIDYKFLCINGKVIHCMVTSNRYSTNKTYSFFNRDWQKIDIDIHYRTQIEERPASFGQMITAAEDLSAEFPLARIDFYEHQSKPYIGEITFFSFGGRPGYHPRTYDDYLGSLLTLPEPNYNIDLYNHLHTNKD